MPNLAQAFKTEIARISRKEARSIADSTKTILDRQKNKLSALEQRVFALEAELKRLTSQATVMPTEQRGEEDSDQGKRIRVTSKGIRSLRRKLGLSRQEFARLLDTSPQSIYLWENKDGPVKMRSKTMSAFVVVREMGAREAKTKLKDLEQGTLNE